MVFFFVVRHAFAAQIFPHPSSAAARRATERKKKRRRRAVAQHPWLCCCSSLQRLGRRVPLAPEQLEEEKQLRSNWERTRAKAFSTISKRSLRRRGARGDGGVQVFAPLFPLLAAAAAAVLFFSLFCCSSSLSSSPSSPEENRAARAISFVAVVIACLNNKARPLSSRSPGLSHYLSLSVRPPHTQKKKKKQLLEEGHLPGGAPQGRGRRRGRRLEAPGRRRRRPRRPRRHALRPGPRLDLLPRPRARALLGAVGPRQVLCDGARHRGRRRARHVQVLRHQLPLHGPGARHGDADW